MLSAATAAVLCVTGMSFPAQQPEPVQAYGTQAPVSMRYPTVTMDYAESNNGSYYGGQRFGAGQIPAGRGFYVEEAASSGSYGASAVNELRNDCVFVGDTVFTGSVYSNNHVNLDFQNPGEGLTVYGNLKAGSAFNVNASWDSFQKVNNNIKALYQEIPYIYVDGIFSSTFPNALEFGAHETAEQDIRTVAPVNIYAGAMQLTQDTRYYGKGDICLYDPALDSTLSCTVFRLRDSEYPVMQTPAMDEQAEPTVETRLGNIYCNNKSLTIGSRDQETVINGDLVFANPEGVLNITGCLEVYGDIICAGTMNVQRNRQDDVRVHGHIYTYSGEWMTDMDMYAWYDGEPERVFHDETGVYFSDDPGMIREDMDRLLYGSEMQSETPYHYAFFPVNARKENLLEQYVRWDLAAGSMDEAQEMLMNDPEIQAGIARGQEWQIIKAEGIGGNRFAPVCEGRGYYRGCIPSGIPLTSDMLRENYGAPYRIIADEAEFKATYPEAGQVSYTEQDVRRSNVRFFSCDYSGAEREWNIESVPVITQSCTLTPRFGDGSRENFIFIDPRANNYDEQNPMAILLDLSQCNPNNPLTILVNNNTDYHMSGSGYDYTSPMPAAVSAQESGAVLPGRQDVLIFLKPPESSYGMPSFMMKNFKLVTTGAYSITQTEEKTPVIGSPSYALLTDPESDDVLSGNPDIYKYQYIPNVTLFGQIDAAYSFQNGALFNANICMPGSDLINTFSVLPSINVEYREYPENALPAETYYSPNLGLKSLGTMTVRSYSSTNGGDIVGLPDRNRPLAEPKVTRQGICGAEGDNLVYMFDETAGILTIDGSGEMAEAAALEWQNDPMFAGAIRYVNLPGGLEALPTNAFANCINLEGDMILPASVEQIGKNAFSGCSKLSMLRIENPLCLIDEPGLDSGTVIMGYRNSTAQTYAAANDYVFVAIDPEETTESKPSVTTVTSTTKAPVTATTTTISSETTKSTAKSTETTTTVSTTAKPVTTTTTTVSTAKPVTTTTTTVSTAKPVPTTTTVSTTKKPVTTTTTTVSTTKKPVTTTTTTASTTKKPVTTTTTTAPTTAKPVTTTTTTASTTAKPVNTTTKPVTTTAKTVTTTLTSRTTVSTVTTTVPKPIPPALKLNGTCGDEGDNVTWELSRNGIMLISGKGQMQNYTAYEETPWADCRDMIEKITIDDGVTNVGSYAFNDCTELYSVSLAKTCTRIGSHAFSGCKRLKALILPQQLTMLDSYAFDGCTRLDYAELPDSLTRIDGWAFRNTALESVTVPKNVASIGNDAFSGCSKLKTITILNPECKIADSENTIPEGTVISGLSGSTAQQYAENYKREFVRLDAETTVSTQTTVTTTVTTVTTARTSETTRSESTAKTDSAKETTVTTTTTVTVKTVTTTTLAPTDTQKSPVTTTLTTISTQTTAKTSAPVNTDTTASVPASATSGTTDTTASETAAPTVPGTTDTHTTAQSTSSERTSGTSGTTASSSTSGTSGTSATSGTSGTSGTSTGTTDTQTGTMPTKAPTTSQKTDTTPAVTVTTETTQKTAASSESTGETTADTTKSTETTTTSASEKQETTTVTTISTAQSVQSGSSSDSTAKTTTTILSESTESVPAKTTVSTSETTVKTETETEPVSTTDDTAETTETTTETTRPTETELTETDTTDSEITDTETTESVTQDTATEPESTEPQETTTVTVADAAFVFTLAEQFNCHSQETRTFAEIGLSPYCKLLVRGGIYAMNEDGQYLDADGNVTEEAVMLEAWEYDVLDWFTINADMDSPQKIWNQETGAHAHAYRISLSAAMADFRSREENGELPEGVTDMLFRSGDTISFDIPVYIGMLGDYNLDDQIRADDAQRALRSYVDSALIGSEFKLLAAADQPDERYRTSLVQYLVGAVNDDGNLDAADAQLILSYYIEHLAGHTDRTFADVRQPEVTLNNSELMLNTEGESRTYQLTLYYGGADTPVWSSSDPAIATVSDDGLVTAKTDGHTLITVRTARGIAYCQVIVGNAEQYPADSD